MSDSIKQRLSGSHIGKMNDKELRKLLLAALTDLAMLRTAFNTISSDNNNVQLVTNNLVALTQALKVTVNNLVIDIVKVNCNTNSPNNTVAIISVAVTNNVTAITMNQVANVAALTLVA
jgi:hypothetical protein